MGLLIQLYLGSQLGKDLLPFQIILINEKQIKREFKIKNEKQFKYES